MYVPKLPIRTLIDCNLKQLETSDLRGSVVFAIALKVHNWMFDISKAFTLHWHSSFYLHEILVSRPGN